MIFYFGGKYNGKLDLVLKKYNKSLYFDIKKNNLSNLFNFEIINNIDEIVNYLLINKIDPISFISNNLEKIKNKVIIGNIITNGVVPIEKHLRLLRDNVGSVFKLITSHSEEVFQVYYGIEVKIK